MKFRNIENSTLKLSMMEKIETLAKLIHSLFGTQPRYISTTFRVGVHGQIPISIILFYSNASREGVPTALANRPILQLGYVDASFL